jgi:hypothetical protein
MLFVAHYGARLDGWDPDYHLIVGNEATGDRPWHGTIRSIALYTGALERTTLAHCATAPMGQRGDGGLRPSGPNRYDFAEAIDDLIPDSGWRRAPLDLLLPSDEPQGWTLSADGLVLSGRAVVRSAAPATMSSQLIEKRQEFTVEAFVQTADLDQTGPARIVSISSDPWHRNFTLAQEGSALDVRVRTPRTGDNGMDVRIRTSDGALDLRPHHVAVVYERGIVRIYIDGRPARRPVRLYSLSAMLCGNDVPKHTAWITLALLLPIGMFAGVRSLARRWPTAIVRGLLQSALLAVLVHLILVFRFGQEVDIVLVVSAPGAALAGVLIGRMLHDQAE